MEILATHTDNNAIIFAIGLTIVAVLSLIVGILTAKYFNAIFYTVTFGALACLLYFGVGEITYYDATVTDWNVVHDQGYEVVEQNGKIVTLRKVGD